MRRRPGQLPGHQGRRRVRGLRAAAGRAQLIAVLVELDLHVPASTSLKAKRGVVRQLQARLRNDLAVSVAEIGHQDLWQRCVLGVAIAAGSDHGARKVAQQVERIVAGDPRVELLSVHVETVGTEP